MVRWWVLVQSGPIAAATGPATAGSSSCSSG